MTEELLKKSLKAICNRYILELEENANSLSHIKAKMHGIDEFLHEVSTHGSIGYFEVEQIMIPLKHSVYQAIVSRS